MPVFRKVIGFFDREPIILAQAKKNKEIVYGARSLEAQGGVIARRTSDYDLFSRNPGKSAEELERELDLRAGEDAYYSRPSKFHKGTHKVIFKGFDGIANTDDDVGVADYTLPTRRVRSRNLGGILYADISEIEKDKRKALSDPKFSHRHAKDSEDLRRIKQIKAFWRP